MSKASHDNESISFPNKKGLSAQQMHILSQGGEEAQQVLFHIWGDLEVSFHGILSHLTKRESTSEFTISRKQGEIVATGTHVDLLLMKVMDNLMKTAIEGEGRIKHLLMDGTENQQAQFKYSYVKDRFLDYKRNSSFRRVKASLSEGHIDIEGKELQSYVSTWDLEKADFPFAEDVTLTRAHELFVIEQFPRINWSGGAKESEVLDCIADWTGIERDNLEERIKSAHVQAEKNSKEKITDLFSKYPDEEKDEDSETRLQRSERIGKILRIKTDCILEPLKCPQLQELFEVTLTTDTAHQNLLRYRELCKNAGLLSSFFSIPEELLFDFIELEESDST